MTWLILPFRQWVFKPNQPSFRAEEGGSMTHCCLQLSVSTVSLLPWPAVSVMWQQLFSAYTPGLHGDAARYSNISHWESLTQFSIKYQNAHAKTTSKKLQAFQLAQLQSLLTRDGDALKIERAAVSCEIKTSAALGDNNQLRPQDESNIKAGCAHQVTARSFMTLRWKER